MTFFFQTNIGVILGEWVSFWSPSNLSI